MLSVSNRLLLLCCKSELDGHVQNTCGFHIMCRLGVSFVNKTSLLLESLCAFTVLHVSLLGLQFKIDVMTYLTVSVVIS